MRQAWFWLLSLIGALVSLPLNADEAHGEGGGWSGNGGGLYQVNDNVWFLGDEAIRACVQVHPAYPLSRSQIEAMVLKSFAQWQSFLARYRMGEAFNPPPELRSLKMARSLVLVACDQETELEILFGLDNEAIRQYRKLHEDDSLGLALRRTYDHQRHRNPGYIWIDAFSSEARRVEHLLLHELGHVLGMKHDSVFVMDRDIALTLKSLAGDDPAAQFLGRIEADFWPFDLSLGSAIRLQPFARRLPGPELPGAPPALSINCQAGSIPLTTIPFEFHPRPGATAQTCLKLSLLKTAERPENNFQLLMHSEQGEWLATIFGSFEPSVTGNEDPMGPGTLSTWPNLRHQTNWTYVPYARRSIHALLSGYFIRGQNRYPAKLSWNRGLTLEIFIPQQLRWWTVRSFAETKP